MADGAAKTLSFLVTKTGEVYEYTDKISGGNCRGVDYFCPARGRWFRESWEVARLANVTEQEGKFYVLFWDPLLPPFIPIAMPGQSHGVFDSHEAAIEFVRSNKGAQK